ncbi:MAG: hypothetical protein HY207_01880 [Nitrospirae bacterium]|nr:hypothetical protein [Nitrospirota bacterium]
MKARILIAGLCCALTGCDIGYGTMRRASLQAVPPLECVRHVVESTPGIARLDYSQDEGGTALTLGGLKSPAYVAYTYFYRGVEGSHIFGILQIHKDHKGAMSLSQNLMYLNVKPPQADIDASRPVMALIEQRLEAECGIVELVKNIKETCHGVTCQEL